MYRRIGNCDTCGAPFAARPGEGLDCVYCGAALPSPLEEVGLGRASLHQLLGEAFALQDWSAVIDVVERIVSPQPETARSGRYLFFAGTIADRKLHDHVLALSYFERAAATDAEWLTPLAARADVHARHGDYREAERELRAAIRRAQASDAPSPLMSSLWQALGALLRDHLDDPKQGQLCFELAARCASSV